MVNNIVDIQLPSGWEYNKLRHIFEFGKGLNITKENLIEDGTPVINYGQVHSKTNTGVGLSEDLIRFVSDEYEKTSPHCMVDYGNFIFADTSEDLDGVGNCVHINCDRKIFAGYHTIIARLKEGPYYSKYFAFEFLTNFWRSQIRSKVMGVKVFSVTKRFLRETSVIIPPYFEQQAIADFLDTKCSQIDSIATDLEKQIELLQQYKKSLITETVTKGLDHSVSLQVTQNKWLNVIPVGWDVSRIKYLVDDDHPYPIGDGDHGMIKADDYLDNGIPYIRVLNLSWGKGLNLDNLVYISEEMNQLIRNSELKPGDILIAKTGATIGKTAIVPNELPRSNTTSHVGKITLSKNHCSKFFFYVMTSDIIQKQIQDMSAMQSTRPELGIEGLKNLFVIVPPLKDQIQIAQYLDNACFKIDEVLQAKQKQLLLIRQHKKSLIYEYVTGKKRVKEAQ